MAVMYTVLSTADTGLLKTPYTKITPSSEVVPAGRETDPQSEFCLRPSSRSFAHPVCSLPIMSVSNPAPTSNYASAFTLIQRAAQFPRESTYYYYYSFFFFFTVNIAFSFFMILGISASNCTITRTEGSPRESKQLRDWPNWPEVTLQAQSCQNDLCAAICAFVRTTTVNEMCVKAKVLFVQLYSCCLCFQPPR